MSDNKACPFCGSRNLTSGGDDKVVMFICLECGAEGPNEYCMHSWNTRPTEEALQADIAELVSVLRDINGYHTGLPYPLVDRIKTILSKRGGRDA